MHILISRTMKSNSSRLFCLLASIIIASFMSVKAQLSQSEMSAVYAVIERTFPSLAPRIKMVSTHKVDGRDVYEHHVSKGKLIIKASSSTAACRAAYDYIRSHHLGIASWSGNRLSLPHTLADSKTRRVVSPFEHHYYLNVVTFGYTMAYWDWSRWEKEIDLMALHGIDMPLSLVANEAIAARVWHKLGLTDDEINAYFTGPAHLPWLRMGNISGLDSPLPTTWHEEQIALEHLILTRMRSLGMKPICPAFAGFVPQSFKRIFPNARVSETSWGGAFHNWMLSPEDSLFHVVGKMFIEEWEKEFGENEYYLADSFNEMDIPFPPKDDPKRYELLASYGEKVYSSIHDANPRATWVMQGWMFGYQRNIWNAPTLSALLSRVPNDKMLLLDLAVDYNRHFWHSEVNWEFYDGFFGKPWVYSVIPNMGGKSGMTGILSFYANGHLSALASPKRGKLAAFGFAPEGLENNEVIYELLSDAGWSDKEINLSRWLGNYSACRYGQDVTGLDAFWHGMLASVYGTFTDHPRYNWQFRPGLVRQGSINANAAFYHGIETLADSARNMKHNALFEYDFCEWAAAYLGAKAEILTRQIEAAYAQADTAQALKLQYRFTHLLLSIDHLLTNHPTHDMQQWINQARKHGGGNQHLSDYYEHNARRIVTIWGPPVDDYSARIWAGLVRDYYLPRWQHYFEQKRTGRTFDFAAWEQSWVEKHTGLSRSAAFNSPIEAAVKLIREASDIRE